MAEARTVPNGSPSEQSSGALAARQKLSGRAFFESIGSPKVILAPMVDQSEFAWRVLTRSFMTPHSGALLAYSPMFHARLFSETQKFRDDHFLPIRRGSSHVMSDASLATTAQAYLDGRADVDRPLTVQFCANNPQEFLEAAKHVQMHCDAVDLNLGCPQRIAKNGKYGAFLQEDWSLVYNLINRLHTELDVPVTAKIRVLETKEKTLEYARMVLSAGASILTVHGRRREQKGHYTGLADWSIIRFLRDNLPPETVLFANGNILRHEDIERCLNETRADAVMSAEGNLHDPSIFAAPPTSSEDDTYWRSPKTGRGGYRLDHVFRRYLSIIYKHVLEQPEPERCPLFVPPDKNFLEPAIVDPHETDGGPPRKKQKKGKKSRDLPPSLASMQAHLFNLLRPLISVHTNVRDALAKTRAGDMPGFEYVLALTETAVREGLREYEENPERFEDVDEKGGHEHEHIENITDHESSLRAVKACKRPWWVCQPYVRPLPKEAIEKGSILLSEEQKRALERENANKIQSAATVTARRVDPLASPLSEQATDPSDNNTAVPLEPQRSSETLLAPATVCG